MVPLMLVLFSHMLHPVGGYPTSMDGRSRSMDGRDHPWIIAAVGGDFNQSMGGGLHRWQPPSMDIPPIHGSRPAIHGCWISTNGMQHIPWCCVI